MFLGLHYNQTVANETKQGGVCVSEDCLCVTGAISFLPLVSFLDILIVTTKNSLATLCQGLKKKNLPCSTYLEIW